MNRNMKDYSVIITERESWGDKKNKKFRFKIVGYNDDDILKHTLDFLAEHLLNRKKCDKIRRKKGIS